MFKLYDDAEILDRAEQLREYSYSAPRTDNYPLVAMLYKFENNYGASIVRHGGTYGNAYGLFELAVVVFPTGTIDNWDLNYDTQITSDVVGYLTVDCVNNILDKIYKLPKYSE